MNTNTNTLETPEQLSARIVRAQVPAVIYDTRELAREAKRAGSHWFDRDTLRWFDSRILEDIYDGRFFISSERNKYGDDVRRYTVREFKFSGYVREDGRECVRFDIDTVGEFGQFATAREAKSFLNGYRAGLGE